MPQPRPRALEAALALFLLTIGTGCFRFDSPAYGQFSESGTLTVELRLPLFGATEDLEVELELPDGSFLPVPVTQSAGQATGSIDASQLGDYRITADGTFRFLHFLELPVHTASVFETAQLADVEECEVMNQVECLLPYPSSRFQAPAATDTGLQLALPAVGMPQPNGPPTDPAPLNELDGFSPFVAVMMNFPGGVDLVASDAPRLLEAGCCGQPAGPPWIDTRTHTDRSLDPDSPTVLLDAETGERILHFVELDARASGPERQLLFLRPAQSLTPGHRYIVAVRGLVDPSGAPVEAEPAADAVLRLRPTTVPAVEEAQDNYVANILPNLLYAGVLPHDLLLAFDFTVQSDDQLTRQMLSMRDQSYAWLDQQIANQVQTFSVSSVEDFDCSVPDTVTARIVVGTFQSPLFLDGDLSAAGVQFMNVDANDVPVQNGVTNPPFHVAIPCVAYESNPIPLYPLLLGHGLFGTGESMVRGIPSLSNVVEEDFHYVAGATDWRGLSSPDFLWVGGQIIGFGSSQLNNFPAFADRLRQGMNNTLVLSRMMKLGVFNDDPAFQRTDGSGVFPGPAAEQFYYGISLGGIMGTWISALTPDIQRFGLDVPAVNFGMLVRRSTQFRTFEVLLQAIGLTDPMETELGIQLLHELWVSAEPAGYATHITRDRLPGSGTDPARILYSPAWLDKQVSNQVTEIAARTLGLPSLVGSLQPGLVGIPDQAGPLDSALVMWDTGSFDVLDPAFYVDDAEGLPIIPDLANTIPSPACDPHGFRPSIPASIQQLFDFLQPGGQISNTCDGICDAGTDAERPGGVSAAALCDPLP